MGCILMNIDLFSVIFFLVGEGGVFIWKKLGMFVGKLNLICKWNLFGCGLNFIWFIIDIILNEV